MKINRAQLEEVLLEQSLCEFWNVPSEDEIGYVFSQEFQEKICQISKKSENAVWRVWQVPLKRAILIAALVLLMLAGIACAFPSLREAIIDFVLMDQRECYGITFEPEMAVNAPRTIEKYMIPSNIPEGYTLACKSDGHSAVRMVWTGGGNDHICYSQVIIPEDATKDDWIGINAEETDRSSRNINGYKVEIISGKEDQQFVAVWTDNRYVYMVDISRNVPDPEIILESMLFSLTEVETID